MREQLMQWLQDNTVESFLKLRETVAASPDYSPYSEDLNEAKALLDEGQFQAVIAHLQAHLTNLLLSPTAHYYLAFAHHQMGAEKESNMEAGMVQLILKGITATGDGSEARPYLVLRISDEYDVLRYLGKKMQQQTLIEHQGKQFDLLVCTDGTQVYFDVTTPMSVFDVG